MDRNFLYGIIVLLSLTDAMIYIQKTDPNLLSKFLPGSASDSWQSKDPGWNQKPDGEKKEEKKDDKAEPKSEANPSEEKQDRQESQPSEPKKRRFFKGCFS